MQLRRGDNLGNEFCTSTCAYITALVPSALVLWFVCTCACAKPIPEIVPMVKLDILQLYILLLKYITSMLLLLISYNLIIRLFISRLAVAKQKKQKTLVLQLSSKAFVRMLHMLGFWKKCPIENFFIWPDFFYCNVALITYLIFIFVNLLH